MDKLDKYDRSEAFIRVLSVLTAFIGVIVASVCISKLGPYTFNDVLFGVNVRATSGCYIFLSFVEIILQIVAVAGLYLDIKIMKIKIPLGNTLWYLVNLIKLVFSGVFILGYLGVFVPISVFSGKYIDYLIKFRPTYISIDDIIISACFVSVFSSVAIIRSIITLIFTLVAKFKYKWPRYDPTSTDKP